MESCLAEKTGCEAAGSLNACVVWYWVGSRQTLKAKDGPTLKADDSSAQPPAAADKPAAAALAVSQLQAKVGQLKQVRLPARQNWRGEGGGWGGGETG